MEDRGSGEVDVYRWPSRDDSISSRNDEDRVMEDEEGDTSPAAASSSVSASASGPAGAGEEDTVMKEDPDPDELVSIAEGISASHSRIKVSAVAHARLLLAKMSATHPAAAAAGRMLEREIEHGPGIKKEEEEE
jgi:hypothetical protein